jgi:hypothetical protein
MMSTAYDSYKVGIPTNAVGSLDFIKQRLAYDWKSIFRTLTQIDLSNSGVVNA